MSTGETSESAAPMDRGPTWASAAAVSAGETPDRPSTMHVRSAMSIHRSHWLPLIAFGALWATLPAASVQALEPSVSTTAAQHAETSEDASESADSVEVVIGIAPEWPFQGFFAPALGRFWDTGRGRVHDVSNGMNFGACYQTYVDVDAESVRMGYVSYPDPEAKHYVIPWGDAAYPVIKRDVTSQAPSVTTAPRPDIRQENFRLTAERIEFTPHSSSWYSDETEITYSEVVTFRAQNSYETKSYLPLASRSFPVDGFVEIESETTPVDDATAADRLAAEYGERAYIQEVESPGSDGRFYGILLYNRAHPVCSHRALTFVVDGITGQVVACHDDMMENVTPLVFVASEDDFILDDFSLPNAMWPVDADGCGVRLDGERPGDFFHLVAHAGLPSTDGREGAGP